MRGPAADRDGAATPPVLKAPQAVGPPIQPRRRKKYTRTTTVASSSPNPRKKNGARPGDVAYEEREVLPEESGQVAQRQEDGGDDRQLLHHHVEPVGHGRDVGVHHAGEQVAVAVDDVGDPDEVVVEVAEVPLRPPRSCPAAPRLPTASAANMSRWGVTTLRIVMSDRFMSKRTPSWASVGLRRMSSSSSSMRSSKAAQHWEVGVDQTVDDHVQERDLWRGVARCVSPLESRTDVVQAPGTRRGAR